MEEKQARNGVGIIEEASCKCKKITLQFINRTFIDISIDNEGELDSCDCDLVEMRIGKKLEKYSISFWFPVLNMPEPAEL